MSKSLKFTYMKNYCNVLNVNIHKLNDPLSHVTFARSMSTVSADDIKENIRPVSEMPGISTFQMMKAMFTKKLTYNGQTIDFNSKQVHMLWGNLKNIFGPIFKMSLVGEPPVVALTNPDDIDRMYRITMDDPVRIGFFALKKVRDEAVDNYFEKKGGILTENHEEWWRVRSKVQTPMMKPKNIVRYLQQMDQVSIEFTDRIAELQKQHGEMPANFQQELYKWALESVGTVALNRRLGCLDPNLPSDSTQLKLIDTVNQMFNNFNKTEMEFPWWRFLPSPTLNKLKKQHETLLSIVHSHIVENEKELMKKISEGKVDERELTLLEILLQTDGLSRRDVVTFMMDMFFAGIDTTSHTIGFTLYLLAKNKAAQKTLQEEIDRVLGDGKDPITEAQMAQLSYLKACIKESLRVFPLVIGNARTLKDDAELGGYRIPKGYTLIGANIITSKDESLFPRANEFIPERWLRHRPLGPIHPYAALPFSHGTRMCIGRRIAEQEMYTLLARVMQRFDIDYKYQDMGIITRLVAVPSEPLRFHFRERK